MTRLRPLPWRTLAVAAASIGVAATPGLGSLLLLDRGAVADGQLWRIVTGHVVHGSTHHLTWNLAGLLAVGVAFERALGRRFWWLSIVSTLAVGAGVVGLDPSLAIYVGLSGVLNGLLFGGALQAARTERHAGNRAMAALYHLVLAGDLAKIAVEAATGTPLFSDGGRLGGAPLPLSHALGALGGALWFGASCRREPVTGFRWLTSRPRARSAAASRAPARIWVVGLVVVASISLMTGCEPNYGVTRSARLARFPDPACVRAVIENVPEVRDLDEWYWPEEPDQRAPETYRSHSFAYRSDRVSVQLGRLLMNAVQDGLVRRCGITELVDGVHESCSRVGCP